MITPVDKYSKSAYILGDVFNPAGRAGMQKQKDQSIYVIVYISLVILLLLGAIFMTANKLAVIPPSA